MTSLAHPSTLQGYLKALNIRPKKALSQNFLVDANIVRNFVKHASLTEDDIVLEIGPGPGAFTQEILKSGAKLIVVEKDPVFAQGLKDQYPHSDAIQIYLDDFLTCDLDQILPKDKKVKVISNLPFQLTSPILGRLFPRSSQIVSCLFIMQKEVADRILAKAKTKAFSSLTVFSHFYSTPRFCFNISPTCFFPRPKITSSAVFFEMHSPILNNEAEFFKMVRTSFRQKRKMLTSTLPFSKTKVQDILKEIGLSEKARPEELDITSWTTLFEALQPLNSQESQD